MTLPKSVVDTVSKTKYFGQNNVLNTSLRRVVLDTNVVLSALLFPNGHLSVIREAWWAGRFNPLVNQVTVSELLRVLSYPKFHLSMSEKEELLSGYVP